MRYRQDIEILNKNFSCYLVLDCTSYLRNLRSAFFNLLMGRYAHGNLATLNFSKEIAANCIYEINFCYHANVLASYS